MPRRSVFLPFLSLPFFYVASGSLVLTIFATAIIAALSSIAENRVNILVLALSLLTWFNVFYYPMRGFALSSWTETFFSPVLNGVGILLGFCFCLIGYLILRRFRYRESSFFIPYLGMILGATFLFLDSLLPKRIEFYSLQVGLCFFPLLLWNVIYCATEVISPDENKLTLLNGIIKNFSFVNAPWAFYKGIDNLKKSRVFGKERLEVQKQGLWLLCNGAIYYSFGYQRFFDWQSWILGVFGVTGQVGFSFFDKILISANGQGLRTSSLWILLILDFVNESFKFFGIGHLAVGAARLAGFNFQRMSNWPFLANSFRDFFNRSNYYYKELLLQVFYYPSFFFFSFCSFAQRKFIALILSVGLGNLLYHLWIEFYYQRSLQIRPSMVIYVACVMVGYMSSVYFPIELLSKRSQRVFNFFGPLRVTCYYFIIHIFWGPTTLASDMIPRLHCLSLLFKF